MSRPTTAIVFLAVCLVAIVNSANAVLTEVPEAVKTEIDRSKEIKEIVEPAMHSETKKDIEAGRSKISDLALKSQRLETVGKIPVYAILFSTERDQSTTPVPVEIGYIFFILLAEYTEPSGNKRYFVHKVMPFYFDGPSFAMHEAPGLLKQFTADCDISQVTWVPGLPGPLSTPESCQAVLEELRKKYAEKTGDNIVCNIVYNTPIFKSEDVSKSIPYAYFSVFKIGEDENPIYGSAAIIPGHNKIDVQLPQKYKKNESPQSKAENQVNRLPNPLGFVNWEATKPSVKILAIFKNQVNQYLLNTYPGLKLNDLEKNLKEGGQYGVLDLIPTKCQGTDLASGLQVLPHLYMATKTHILDYCLTYDDVPNIFHVEFFEWNSKHGPQYILTNAGAIKEGKAGIDVRVEADKSHWRNLPWPQATQLTGTTARKNELDQRIKLAIETQGKNLTEQEQCEDKKLRFQFETLPKLETLVDSKIRDGSSGLPVGMKLEHFPTPMSPKHLFGIRVFTRLLYNQEDFPQQLALKIDIFIVEGKNGKDPMYCATIYDSSIEEGKVVVSPNLDFLISNTDAAFFYYHFTKKENKKPYWSTSLPAALLDEAMKEMGLNSKIQKGAAKLFSAIRYTPSEVKAAFKTRAMDVLVPKYGLKLEMEKYDDVAPVNYYLQDVVTETEGSEKIEKIVLNTIFELRATKIKRYISVGGSENSPITSHIFMDSKSAQDYGKLQVPEIFG